MSRTAMTIVLTALLTIALAVPAGAQATTDTIEGFGSVLAVARPDDFPVASLMRVDCTFLRRIQRPDGSAVENLRCSLSDVPVMIPAFQGQPPSTTFIDVVGSCQWMSEYWFETNGSTVFAESVRYVVTPSGEVHATSVYPAVPLSCE